MFHVLNLETNKLYETPGGIVYAADNGADAAEIARIRTECTGQKHQVRRATVSVDWQARERARFADGTYKPIPDVWTYRTFWGELLAAFPDHYAHPSVEKGSAMIAYTPDAEHGAADRQLRITPGRYLQRFAPTLGAPAIATLATLFLGEYEEQTLQLATTADDIENIYRHGPSSCMAGDSRGFEGHMHPVRVYAAGDLALAYIRDAGADNRFTARALCWPERKVYGRVYGDETRLRRLFETAGYSFGSLSGAKIAKVENENGDGWIMPYLDNLDGVNDAGRYFTLSGCGADYSCGSTSGVMEEEEHGYCENCEDRCRADDMSMVYTSRNYYAAWCDGCASERTFYCEATGRTYSDDVANMEVYFSERHSVTWSEYYCENHATYCSAEDIYVNSGLAVYMSDGEHWSQWKFDADGATCPRCGENFPADDMLASGYCSDICEHAAAAKLAADTAEFEAICQWTGNGAFLDTLVPLSLYARVAHKDWSNEWYAAHYELQNIAEYAEAIRANEWRARAAETAQTEGAF